jgi:hypothetical protein
VLRVSLLDKNQECKLTTPQACQIDLDSLNLSFRPQHPQRQSLLLLFLLGD